MPYAYVDPDLFMRLPSGEAVYHCYRHGMRQDILYYHYQIMSDYSDTGWMAFDVRNLEHEQHLDDVDLSHEEVIEMATKAFLPTLEDTLCDLEAWYPGEG